MSRKISRIGLSIALLTTGGCDHFTKSCSETKTVAGTRLGLRAPRPAKAMPPETAVTPTIERFASCQELQDTMRAAWESSMQWTTPYDDLRYPYADDADGGDCRKTAKQSARADASDGGGSMATPLDEAAPAESSSGTNVQERGVDESDRVKVGDHHVYVQTAGGVQVLRRAPLALLGALSTSGISDAELYAEGDALISVDAEARVRIYRAESGAMPVLVKEHDFPGQLVESRYTGGRLVLVISDALPFNAAGDAAEPVAIAADGQTVSGVRCDQIVRPAIADGDARLVKIISLNPARPEEPPQSTAFLGGGDHLYMTPTALYVGKIVNTWSEDATTQRDQLVLTKSVLDPATGAVAPAAVGVVTGRVKDQWAFKELPMEPEPVLAVATTTGQLLAELYGGEIAQNHLWILQRQETRLVSPAAIHDFGTGEDIRSVRYVGPYAYVVTFKKTDPLFAFDLSKPLEPKLLGELKVPGFSVYMHPVADGRLVGVGFDAEDQGDFAYYQGVQVSLFDVADPLAPRRLDNVVIGQRGSSSDVTGDHHAFYFDSERHLIGVPAVELVGKQTEGGSTYGNEVAFSGAILFRVDDQRLVEAARVTHADLIPPGCADEMTRGTWWQDTGPSLDVNRLLQVDGELLSVSRYGVKTHALDASGTQATIAFPPLGDELARCLSSR
jgi:uncharacterized secreted protein with C-terminal beta-propeller domain